MAADLEAVADERRLLAQAAGENFPVASRVLPAPVRSHLMAIYGFARLVDDVGDEAPGDRLALLDEVERELDVLFEGGRSPRPVMDRLGGTIRRFSLPRDPFLRLIEANRRDQTVDRYESFDQLLGYCELSANPVGHLVLLVLRVASPRRVDWSDAICTGLQLTEHWQDVAEDAKRGRVYLPQEDLRRFGVTEEELLGTRPAPAFRRLMAFEVDRARALLSRGLPLASDLGGRAGFAVAAFVAGGRAALRAIEGARYDVLSGPPRASSAGRTAALAGTLLQARVWRGSS
jgi:squalene synthase HpnC